MDVPDGPEAGRFHTHSDWQSKRTARREVTAREALLRARALMRSPMLDNNDRAPRLLGFFWRLQGGHGVLRHFDFNLFGHLKHERGFFDPVDGAINTSRRNDLIAGLEIGDHFINLLLSLTGRENHEKVKDHHNNQRQ